MSNLSFERSRQAENGAKLFINICKGNVEIIRIKGLNLTYFLQFFLKVNL